MTRDVLLGLRPGARLRLTALGRESFPRRRGDGGAFVRIVHRRRPLPGSLILVIPDGCGAPQRFAADYWEPET